MENLIPLTPVNFFQLYCNCLYIPYDSKNSFALNEKNFTEYLLPDTSTLTDESHFANVAMGWNEEGLEIFARVIQPFQQSSYPQLDRGDSLEVCVDTRNIKTSGYNTRFCHHFFCLAMAKDSLQVGEITKFRTEDTHELCNQNDLKALITLKKTFYLIQFFIPTHCLFGYNPEEVSMLGFT